MSLRIGLGLGLGVIPTSARPVPTGPPVNDTLPSFPRPWTQGQTVTANPGGWSGLPSSAFAYQRQRWNGSSWVNVGGATAQAQTFDASDFAAGTNGVRLAVTATNGPDSTTAYSLPITIAAPLDISGTPGVATVGVPYNFTPTAVGGRTPRTFALTGTPLAGLSSFNTATGAISGTAVSSGTASGISITVTDADGLTDVLGPFSLTAEADDTGEMPAGVDAFKILGDIYVASSQADAGSVHYPTNGYGIEMLAPGFAPIASVDPTKVVIHLKAQKNNPDRTVNPDGERVVTGWARIFKTAPDTGQYADSHMRATGGFRLSTESQIYNPDPSVVDHLGRDGWGDRVDRVELLAGAINGASPPMTIPGSLVERLDSRPYDPIPWKHDTKPFEYVTANGTTSIGLVATDEHHEANSFIACAEAWPEAWDGSIVGDSVFAEECTESEWTAGGLSDEGSGLTYDEWRLSGISMAGMPHGKVGIKTRVYPHFGPAQSSVDHGDDFDTAASQNLFQKIPVYHDLVGDRTPIYAKVKFDGTGITLNTDTSGIFTSEAAARASSTYYSAFHVLARAARYWNNSTTNRPGGKHHDDPDNLHIILEDTPGAAGADAYSYSVRGTALAICNYIAVTVISDLGTYSEDCRIRGVNHDGSTPLAADKVWPFSKTRLVGIWLDARNTEESRSLSPVGKGTAIRFGSGSPGQSTPAGSTPANVSYLELVDCYAESHSATSQDVVLSETGVTYIRRGKNLNAPLRNGFGDHAGSVVTVGHWQDGNRGVLDGHWAMACKLTGGSVVMAQSSSRMTRPNIVNSRALLQYNCLLLTNNGTKAALGAANHNFGRDINLAGARRIGCVMGRFGALVNTMFDLSSDGIIAGYRGDMTLGLTMLGGGVTNRVNWHYSSVAFEQVIKETFTRYSNISGSSMKDSYFIEFGGGDIGASTNFPYSALATYYPGQVVYDATTGGGTPETGAVTTQIRSRKLSDDSWIVSVPPGTAFNNPEYYLDIGYRGGDLGQQCRRNGNLRARQQVGCHGNTNIGDAISIGASPGFGEELGNVSCPGVPHPDYWGKTVAANRYMNDTSGPGGDINALDARPNPLGPCMGLRPAGRAWDKRDMFGNLRHDDVAGPSGALELGDIPFELTGSPDTTGVTGQSYSFVPTAIGGATPYGYSLSGSLTGSGLSFNTSTGALTASSLGSAGTYGPFTITGTDDDAATDAIGPFSIVVSAVPTTVRASSGTVRASSNTVRASSG